MKISIVKDYTDKPGARYFSQGPFPGEEFRDEILYPKFLECLENNDTLEIDLDGGYGYGSSFLEEAFGGLVRKLFAENKEYKNINKFIIIVSNDNKSWVKKIEKYINEAIANPSRKEK